LSRCTIFLTRSGEFDTCSKATMGKYKKIWDSKEERDAWEAHVDETLRRLREAIESIRAREKRASKSA